MTEAWKLTENELRSFNKLVFKHYVKFDKYPMFHDVMYQIYEGIFDEIVKVKMLMKQLSNPMNDLVLYNLMNEFQVVISTLIYMTTSIDECKKMIFNFSKSFYISSPKFEYQEIYVHLMMLINYVQLFRSIDEMNVLNRSCMNDVNLGMMYMYVNENPFSEDSSESLN
jgi:hypothetical protein